MGGTQLEKKMQGARSSRLKELELLQVVIFARFAVYFSFSEAPCPKTNEVYFIKTAFPVFAGWMRNMQEIKQF